MIRDVTPPLAYIAPAISLPAGPEVLAPVGFDCNRIGVLTYVQCGLKFVRTVFQGKMILPLQMEEFEESAEKAKSLPPATKDADKLILYGLYKQATVGAVNTNRPGMFSPKERAKWDAWKTVEGKTKEEAMTDYITKVKELQEITSA
ncbi:hypothetical protein L1049_022099 [Liquidambar formosana]|uniref:ACB domain-containing protein n=1 Tax=Liquidambar formosana TaxID=63359 RepID=A0AAP0RBY2_LIQFO